MDLPTGAGLNQGELHSLIVESADSAIIAKDLNGLIQSWNQGAEKLYGYNKADIIGRSILILVPPDRVAEEADILRAIRSGQRVDLIETTRLRKDGTSISVAIAVSPIWNARGELVGASHIARNITERSQMETATAQLAAVVDSSEDAIISKNLDGVILTWNAGAERLYGYSAEEVRWRPMTLLLPQDRSDEEAEILSRLKLGERVEHFETLRLRKDGKIVAVSVTVSPIRDKSGAVRGASHVARDITEKRALQAQLLQTQKLESLGVLAGGVAHDFNNLLVGILANSSLIVSTLPASNPNRTVIAEVVTAAERAAALTRQLLAYAGKGSFVIEAVNLSHAIREISVLVQTSIPPNVQVRLELPEDLPLIEGDSGQLQQVIMNLMINGAEAIGNGPGMLVVTSSVQDVDEQYSQTIWGHTELPPGRYTVLEVHDSGIGMDEETLEKIFDPFFTTKFAGRGLGLAAVLGIIRSHKGALKVYSAPGKGSTFKVFFPVVEIQQKPPVPEPVVQTALGSGTVLIVDDEEIVRKAAAYTLKRYGYKVLVAGNGADAIKVFRERHQDTSLVLLDLTMPGLSGEEVMRQLQTINPAVRVLLSSGFNEVEAVRHFTGKGLAGFIQKPYTSPALAAKVKESMQKAVEGQDQATS